MSQRTKLNQNAIEVAPLDVSISQRENDKHEQDTPMIEEQMKTYEQELLAQPIGRLTIGSINNVGSNIITKSEFKRGNTTNAHQSLMHTPFDFSPNQDYFDKEIDSQEKLLRPIFRGAEQNFNSQKSYANKTALFLNKGHLAKNHIEIDYKSNSFQAKNRDSLILSQKREKQINPRVISLRDDQSNQIQQQQNRMSFFQEEFEELPPLTPNSRPSQVQVRDHRFSIRQIQFNLISSLKGTQERSSMLSRASSKLMKGFQPSNRQYSPKKDIQSTNQCPPKCARGIQAIFNCFSNPGASSRSKTENISSYSNASTFGKALQKNNNFQQNDNSSSFAYGQVNGSVFNREDFNDEVDEYENDSNSHRLSIVKRYNINAVFFSPGSRISQSPGRPINEIESFKLDASSRKEQVQLIEEEIKEEKVIQSQKQGLSKYVTKVSQVGRMNSQNHIDNQNQHNVVDYQDEIDEIDERDIQVQDLAVNLQNQQKSDESLTSSSGVQVQDVHRLHFFQTIQALHFIKNGLTMPSEREIEHLKVNLPAPNQPHKKKTIIFDMDETLIHCVDDIESEDPMYVLSIQFPDEDLPVSAGINVRPYIYECLEEANKYFQVIVFTASHKSYADPILDFIDPEGKYIQYRMYRDNCVFTKEGFYVKDLRVIGNRSLNDLVIVDNSVYSFSFQIDNGIPIIPYYEEKEDEEMLHLIYYLNCLHQVEDVREQNKEAFELAKLQSQSPNEILTQYYTNNAKQLLLQNEEEDEDDDEEFLNEENQQTEQALSEEEKDEDFSGEIERKIFIEELEDRIKEYQDVKTERKPPEEGRPSRMFEKIDQ